MTHFKSLNISDKKLHVLITGYEAAPFYKRGGLGDVLGSLPTALKKIGVDVRVVIPYYKVIQHAYIEKKIGDFFVRFDKKNKKVEVYTGTSNNKTIRFYFIKSDSYLSIPSPLSKIENIDEFAFFDLAVVELTSFLAKQCNWHVDIIHCNDWHTGLIPLIAKDRIPTLLTIHNLNYQGRGSTKVLDLLDIKDQDAKALKRGKVVNQINVLGEGIIHATRVSTVSPTYAKEIVNGSYHRDPINSFLLRREEESSKKKGFIGILNGIDYNMWNPDHDRLLFHRYNATNWQNGKNLNKKILLEKLGLSIDRPTICFIGRMASQKGLDSIIKVEDFIASEANLILLGSGDKRIENTVLKMSAKYFGSIRVNLVYDEKMAHVLYSSCDFIIIPSHYEPCGLIQMIAMRYGTIPIASATGGLKDSIINGTDGFLFKSYSKSSLKNTLMKAFSIYKNQSVYKKMVDLAMKKDFSWDRSAKLYKSLYNELI